MTEHVPPDDAAMSDQPVFFNLTADLIIITVIIFVLFVVKKF